MEYTNLRLCRTIAVFESIPYQIMFNFSFTMYFIYSENAIISNRSFLYTLF